MKLKLILITICMSCSTTFFGHNANLKNIANTIHFQQNANGVPTNSLVTVSFQDNHKTLWIGTSVNDYDGNVYTSNDNGKSFQKFITSDFKGIVFAMMQDDQNNLWFGTLDALYMSSNYGKNWTNVSHSTSYVMSVTNITEDSQHVIWVASDSGLWKTTNYGKSFVNVNVQPLGTDATYSAFKEDNHHNLWAGVFYYSQGEYTGVYRSTDFGKTWQFMFANWIVSDICQDKNNDILLGTRTGVFISSDFGAHFKEILFNKQSLATNRMYIDSENNIWAGSVQMGLWESNDNAKTWTQNLNGLKSSWGIRSIYQDSTNNYWLGTFQITSNSVYNFYGLYQSI